MQVRLSKASRLTTVPFFHAFSFISFGKFGFTLKLNTWLDQHLNHPNTVCLKSLGAPWLYTGDLHSSYYATSKNNNCASDVFGCVSDKRVTTYIIFIYSILYKLDYVVEMSSFSLCHISLFQKVLVVCFLSCYYYYYTVFLSVIWSADIYHHWESIYIPPHYPSVVLTDQVINYMQFTFTFLIVFFLTEMNVFPILPTNQTRKGKWLLYANNFNSFLESDVPANPVRLHRCAPHLEAYKFCTDQIC